MRFCQWQKFLWVPLEQPGLQREKSRGVQEDDRNRQGKMQRRHRKSGPQAEGGAFSCVVELLLSPRSTYCLNKYFGLFSSIITLVINNQIKPQNRLINLWFNTSVFFFTSHIALFSPHTCKHEHFSAFVATFLWSNCDWGWVCKIPCCRNWKEPSKGGRNSRRNLSGEFSLAGTSSTPALKRSFEYKNIHRWSLIAGSFLLGELVWDLILIRICWVMNIHICRQSKHVQDLCVLCNVRYAHKSG